ncbi:MAG: hypothetical protein NZ585_13275 [Chloracidobacterium sp.]|nr:hypothetical protein [Chloracidobacterium sp.]MDW8218536.1 hypothetical protein [Acidobacteriota bacterium]
MPSLAALGVRVYLTDWGDVRIETRHQRQTLPPNEFVRRLYAALPRHKSSHSDAPARTVRGDVHPAGRSVLTA